MKALRTQTPVVTLVAILLVCALPSSAEGGDVKGFPGIPIYIGADFPCGTQMENLEWAEQQAEQTLQKEGYIWYEFGEKLAEEYDKDARGVDGKIVDFYKKELEKRGWNYIGEGVRIHHWTKGKEAIGISFPADCTIEYKHMSSEEAKANIANLNEEEFIEAFVKCAKEAQKVYEKHGIKTWSDLEGKSSEIMSEKGYEEAEKFAEKLNLEVKETIGKTLKPFGVSVNRFKELKPRYEDLIPQYFEQHEEEFTENILGFSAMN
ncbi:hypothetical protein CH333_09860 [candidate division WOR-3 bacterium JGI_Cruoil_03_44_89]|uniref:Uncharacterized protein n=1 Tax=candidate division WOR-3 bacterium JGI_Cruoil_03_44_89 TaxID=1973748 RepID=A0A235BMZ6_UNCW3|nr:MAG: hypothetical protein CH333_09860 [candidate division WOR-3 bacterium JGI_Cruoil_03_44_89]